MIESDIYERLTPLFQDVFDRDDIVPNAGMMAADVDGWDSLAHIRLIVAIEQDFGVRFTAAQASNFASVGDMVVTLRKKLDA